MSLVLSILGLVGLTVEQAVIIFLCYLASIFQIKWLQNMADEVKNGALPTWEDFANIFNFVGEVTEAQVNDFYNFLAQNDFKFEPVQDPTTEQLNKILHTVVIEVLNDVKGSLENATVSLDSSKIIYNTTAKVKNFLTWLSLQMHSEIVAIKGTVAKGDPIEYGNITELMTSLKNTLIENGKLAEGSVMSCTNDFITLMNSGYQYLTAVLLDTGAGYWAMRVVLTKEPVGNITYTYNSEFFGYFKGCVAYLFNEAGEDITDFYAIADTTHTASISLYGVRRMEDNYLSEEGNNKYSLTTVQHITTDNSMSMGFDGRGLDIALFAAEAIILNGYAKAKTIGAGLTDKAKDAIDAGIAAGLTALGIAITNWQDIDSSHTRDKTKVDTTDTAIETDEEAITDAMNPAADPADTAEEAGVVPHVAEQDVPVEESPTVKDPTITVENTPTPTPPSPGNYPVPVIALPNVNTTTNVDGFITMYKMTPTLMSQLASFTHQSFLDDVMTLQFKKLFNDPSEAFISLNRYKTQPSTSGSGEITLRSIQTGITAPIVRNWVQHKYIGQLNVPRKYNNYLDYPPFTKVRIYLPFIGWEDLPTEEVMGTLLSVDYYFEYLSGGCKAVIFSNKNGIKTPVSEFSGNCNEQIPLTGNDFTQVSRALIGGVAGVAAAVAAPSPLTIGAAAMGIGGALTTAPSVSRSGSMAGNVSNLGNMKCMLQIERPKIKLPDNYAQLNGLPSNMKGSINSLGLKGFVQFDEIQLGNIGCTDAEKQELLDELKSGIFI